MSNIPKPGMPRMSVTPSREGYSDSGSESKKRPSPTSGTKRRPSRAGTRSVNTLTAAQLERKRANDREAQRAIRQRTKDHIESLERRVAELTARQESNTELMSALKRNEELQQENAMLRERLNHALAALGTPDHQGLGVDNSMIAPATPSSREGLPVLNPQRCTSTTTVRNVPSVSHPAQAGGPSTDQWHQTQPYTSTASSPMQPPPPAVQDVSVPPSNAPRWNQQPHPHQHQVNASLPMHSDSIPAVEHAVPPQLNYPSYVIDQNGRPVQYQLESQQMAYGQPGASAAPPPPAPQGYPQRHMSVQLSQATTAYRGYSQPQSYMPSNPHPGDSMQMMPQQPMDNAQIMYGVPPNMKVEQ